MGRVSPMETPRHFVAGTDFSACAERALELGILLALAPAARITVVHVCELGADDLDDWRLRQGDAALSALVARYRGCGVELTGLLRCGRPWEKLDNVAVEVGACLIVVGRQGAGGARGLRPGSVAETLARSANRPVLTVPCPP